MRNIPGVVGSVVLALTGCSSDSTVGSPAASPAAAAASTTGAAATSTASPFPTSGPVPPSIGNDVIGGALCSADSAFWSDVDGHPEVQVFAPGPSSISISFLGDGGNALGSDQVAEIREGMSGAHLVGSDVTSSQVRAVSLAIAGATVGSCVAPKV